MKYVFQRFTMAIVFTMASFRFYKDSIVNEQPSALCLYWAFIATIYVRELDKIKPANKVFTKSILSNATHDVNVHSAKLDTLTDEQVLVLCKIIKYEMAPLIKRYIRGKISIFKLYRVFDYHLLDTESVYHNRLLDLGTSVDTLNSVHAYLYSTMRYIVLSGSVEWFQRITTLYSENVIKFSQPFNFIA
jgi:hypothetical protein